jgi:hypothetical protein
LGNRSTESPLSAFYRGEGHDQRGRSLADIQEFDFDELEFNHDYIQWLFPLPEPSGANPEAPVLSAGDIAAFNGDDALRRALLQSLQVMLAFYGLDLRLDGESIRIERRADFDERCHQWLARGNHNFLRISRMLRSLSLLGLGSHAMAFLECLEGIYADNATTVGSTTIGYWRRAITP